MKNDKLRQFLVVFVILSTIIMNYLSNALPFGGQTNGQVSNKYFTAFTPAGFAFSIWGVIYLGLLGFAIYQALPSQRTNPRFRATGLLVMLNGVFNSLWLPIFQNEWLFVSVLFIAGILYTLYGINVGLRLKAPEVPAVEKWLARVPYGLYFGWVTVATIANVCVWLKSTNWNGWGISGPVWAQILIVVGLAIGLFVFNRMRIFSYLLVFVWAFSAIAVGQQGNGSVSLVAAAGASIAAIVWLFSYFQRPKSPSHPAPSFR
ncbi:tryptophan-rich sensory protein [Larkinella knui]|uniref:Tryptophan-rich sensory protein n=1 Tax=Larkinella knui TaxID=2025310 RepID=A0A3P1CR54_9BACT|nr:tryptophan-rich sensory protein [Larkinella knui]RRB15566.1 tryptophan-rich sensory protein [Larkinella knui]